MENVNKSISLSESTPTTASTRTRKRKGVAEEEPLWFNKYRQDEQQRHNERMQRQDKMLEILNELIQHE